MQSNWWSSINRFICVRAYSSGPAAAHLSARATCVHQSSAVCGRNRHQLHHQHNVRIKLCPSCSTLSPVQLDFSLLLTHPLMSLVQPFQHLSLHWDTPIYPDHGHPVLWGSANFRLTGLHTWYTSDCLSDCWHNRGCVHVCGPAHQCNWGRGHSSDYRWYHQWGRGRGRDQRWHNRQLCDPRGLHAGQQQQRRGSWQQSELLTHRPRLSGHCEYYRGRGE